MLEFIARGVFAKFSDGAAQTADAEDSDNQSREAVRQIHADWMLTPRDDLGGACPREIAVARRDHISWDLQDRCEFWTVIGRSPRGLDKSSHAYRFGGFGTHELVVYYELVRALLWSCQELRAA